MVCAALGSVESAAQYQHMPDAQRQHYEAWAAPFHTAVGGVLGFLPGRAYHLWHGDLEHRGYGTRYEGFAHFAFDPEGDIAPGCDGCWDWSSPKPAMHDYVASYFASRREDG